MDERGDGGGREMPVGGTDRHDDDELAAALADEISRYTASIPVITPDLLPEPAEPVLPVPSEFVPSFVDDVPAAVDPEPFLAAFPSEIAAHSEMPVQQAANAFDFSASETGPASAPEWLPVPEDVPVAAAQSWLPSSPTEVTEAAEEPFHRAEPEAAPAEAPAYAFVPPPLNEPSFSPPQQHADGMTPGISSLLLAAPPPAPNTVVVPPPGSELPAKPRKRSLDDGDLATVVEKEAARTGSALGAIDELETQLQLRAEEQREFSVWERSMLAIGTPEAIDEVERARPVFTGLITVIPAGDAAAVAVASAAPPIPQDVQADGVPAESVLAPIDWSAEAPAADDAPPALVEPPEPDIAVRPSFDSAETAISDALREVPEDDLDEPVSQEIPQVAPVAAPASTQTGPAVVPAPAPVFASEEPGVEPTPLEQRNSRSVSLFWMWFAVNSSAVGIALGIGLFALGMSARQALVAALAGIALSFIPLALGTLAGRWSGQPTMIVSRAVFGIRANIVPAVLAVLTRVFWGAAMLWFIAEGAAVVLDESGLLGGFGMFRVTVVTLAIVAVPALIIAYFGHRLISRVFLVLSILSAVLTAAFIAMTWTAVDLSQVLSKVDGPWILVVSGAVLVFSFIGLAWANSGADVARYQRTSGSGAASMLWATVGMAVPSLILIGYGIMLAASQPATDAQSAFGADPFGLVAGLVPDWFALPLLAALGLSLLCGTVLAIYSGGFALQASGVALRRQASVLIAGLLTIVVALALTFAVDDFFVLIRDLATTIAVPVAAWAGLFAAELMIRNRRFDSSSLLRVGGVYPAVNWVNLGALVIASVIGYGLTTAAIAGLDWQGYLYSVAGLPLTGDVAGTDIGVLVALAIGLLTPLVSGVPAIRRQERAQG
ncbi:purine-cytosine permease-like protein [Homoserinimonas aerilata]|uniref:Purine-cytosine permease-like protein n=1 Tax=Homoserinimonas aerilata TaxID=1162970 RepID=A0A542YIU6_9MICO|nr:cytosine permease [Homoserinimonas aerilata]TQL47894.1 purine-cytosine permease-like protein [Homoserinimonas aerilata]